MTDNNLDTKNMVTSIKTHYECYGYEKQKNLAELLCELLDCSMEDLGLENGE